MIRLLSTSNHLVDIIIFHIKSRKYDLDSVNWLEFGAVKSYIPSSIRLIPDTPDRISLLKATKVYIYIYI